MVALDVAGVISNIQMLRCCFRIKSKHTVLQICKTLTTFQCACQDVILVTDVVESWREFDIQPRDSLSCNVFQVLPICLMFFQACNITVIMVICSEHRVSNRNREGTSKLKIPETLYLGFVGSVMIWQYGCQGPLSWLALFVVPIVVVALLIILFIAASRNSVQDQFEDSSPEGSMKIWCTVCNVFEEHKRGVFIASVVLTCLVAFLCDAPIRSLGFKEVLYSLTTRFVVGIVLPLTVCNLVDLSFGQENDKGIVLV